LPLTSDITGLPSSTGGTGLIPLPPTSTATDLPPSGTSISTALPPSGTETTTGLPPSSTGGSTVTPPSGSQTTTDLPPTGTGSTTTGGSSTGGSSTATDVPPSSTGTSSLAQTNSASGSTNSGSVTLTSSGSSATEPSSTSGISPSSGVVPTGSSTSSGASSVTAASVTDSAESTASVSQTGLSTASAPASTPSEIVSQSETEPAPSTTVPVPATTSKGPISIVPTSTDTFTTQQLGTSVILQATSSESTTTTMETGIPSTLPQVIPPPGLSSLPVAPPNTTLCQIGFKKQLNYNFVISHHRAIQEIFDLLPPGVGYGCKIGKDQITMQSLQPFDTTGTYGYITTVAMFYMAEDLVPLLQLQISRKYSTLYKNPDPSINTIMNVINPEFPLIAGGGMDGQGGGSGTDSPTATASATANAADPLSANNSSKGPVVGTTVGISVGVVCGAALYGAAMFFVAKRYRKRKNLHRRSPSLIDTSSMAQSHGEMMTGAGTALMGGSRGHSGDHAQGYYGSGRTSRGSGHSGSSRGRDISAPVQAENSLGWN